MTGRRAASLAAAALLAVAALAGCGIQSDDGPRELAADDVPFGLLEPTTTSTSTTEPGAGRTNVDVFLVRDELLEPQTRPVAEQTPRGALESLLGDIAAEEDRKGFRTAIPVDTRLRDLRQPTGSPTVVVDLSDEFLSIQGSQQIKALAQVVCTLTDQRFDGPRITGVRFAFEGQMADVPNGDSELTSEPLTCQSYAALTDPAAAADA